MNVAKLNELQFEFIAERRKPSGFVEIITMSPDGLRRSASIAD